MPVCAVIDKRTKRVVNLIVADPAVDTPPDGCLLEDVSDKYCEIGDLPGPKGFPRKRTEAEYQEFWKSIEARAKQAEEGDEKIRQEIILAEAEWRRNGR